MVRVLGCKVDGRRFESGQYFLFFFRMRQFFFAFFRAISTHALTHASNLRKFAKPYMRRKFDAQSAHVARLRRYCANHKVAQYRRKIGALWAVGESRLRGQAIKPTIIQRIR